MIHLAKSLVRKLWIGAILLVILAGAVILAGRGLTPLVAEYRAEIEQQASSAIGQPVRIERIAARWRGLGPELVLQDVSLLASGSDVPALKIAEIRVRVALVDSLREMALKSRLLTFSGLQLLIKRQRDGSIALMGLEHLETSGQVSSGLFLLPSRIRVEKSRVFWENLQAGTPPVLFPDVSAELRNDNQRHQLNARVGLADGEGELELAADIFGDITRPAGWRADLHLAGAGLPLQGLLQQRLPADYQIDDGDVDFQVWGSWQENRFARLRGEIDLHELALTRTGATVRLLAFERLGSAFQWQQLADGWRLELQELLVRRGGRRWPTANLALETRYGTDGAPRVRAGASFLRSEDLIALVRMLPVTAPNIDDALDGLQPSGDIRDLRLLYNTPQEGPAWSASGRIDQLNTEAWGHVPKIEGIDASFVARPDGGTLALDSRFAIIEFPRLFRVPMQLNQLEGLLHWRPLESEPGWRVDSDLLQATTYDIKTRTRLSMHFPSDPDASVYLDLQSDFHEGRVTHAPRYYPVGIMPETLVSWLDRSIVSGEVVAGSALVRGPLRHFPFHRTHDGRFQVLFRVRDTLIDYFPGWPRLNGVSGEVQFLNNSFDAWLDGGTVYDSTLTGAHAHIEQLAQGSPLLLNGEVAGPFSDNLRLLRESPLAGRFAEMTAGMEGSGQSRLGLDLQIPLRRGPAMALGGRVDLVDAGLDLQHWRLPLQRINGRIEFDAEQVHATGIRGELFGNPVEVDVAPHASPLIATRISTRAELPARQIDNYFEQLSLHPFSGRSDWHMQLDLPSVSAAGRAPELTVRSSLIGTEVTLPQPFGKRAEQLRPLTIETRLRGGDELPLRLRYGGLLDARLLLGNGGAVESGELWLGPGEAPAPLRPGVAIAGHLPLLQLDGWGGNGDNSVDPALLQRVDLRLDQATLGELTLRDLAVDLRRREQAFEGRVSGQRFDGRLKIPDAIPHQPVEVELARLTLSFDPDELQLADQDPVAQDPPVHPSELPPLSLTIDRLTINEQPFGNLQLLSQHHSDALKLQHFTLSGPLLQLTASGEWRANATASQQSELGFTATTDQLGELLAALGFAQNLADTPAVLDGRLQWPDAPHRLRAAILDGELSLATGKGRFLELNPGIGRVFGLLNVGALQRRLSLDFSDLQPGFAFDTIEGSFTLDDGDAYSNDTRIRAPSALIEISGRIGLTDNSVDQLVTVTPNVSAALPLVGVLAGGPVGGAAMLLAQGLIGKGVNRATLRQYQLRGPMDDPLVQRLNADGTLDELPDNEAATPVTRTVDTSPAPPANADQEPLPRRIRRALRPTEQRFEEAREDQLPGG